MAFTIIITMLPKAKQPIGLALFALSATFAPAIGPTIGGYLTENWGWQYIFYVNLVPGAVMVGALWFSLERAADAALAAAPGRLAGIATMAIGLARCRPCWRKATRTTGSARPSSCAVGHRGGRAVAVPLDRTDQREAAAQPAAAGRRNFGFGTSPTSCSASRSTARSSSCRSIWRASRATIPSRSAWCWPGPACRSCVLIPLVPRLMKRVDVA
jgi:DHA2 family multidrug resistance protein